MGNCCQSKSCELQKIQKSQAMTNSAWPDIVVGLGIALLFLKSSISVLKTSRLELTAVGQQKNNTANHSPSF